MKFEKKTFMPFLVLGDPTYEESLSYAKALIDGGAHALELGFAFSDPISDGPVIQAGNYRALQAGITTTKSFEIISKIREYSDIPLSIMVSFNLVLHHGIDSFYASAKKSGVNAILIPDLPLEESEQVLSASEEHSLDQVFIVSPTTSESRMKQIATHCKGYVYLVSLKGTTGVRGSLDNDLNELVSLAKKHFSIPLYVGFGISTPSQVKDVLDIADGAIVGSAIVKKIEEKCSADELKKFSSTLSSACK